METKSIKYIIMPTDTFDIGKLFTYELMPVNESMYKVLIHINPRYNLLFTNIQEASILTSHNGELVYNNVVLSKSTLVTDQTTYIGYIKLPCSFRINHVHGVQLIKGGLTYTNSSYITTPIFALDSDTRYTYSVIHQGQEYNIHINNRVDIDKNTNRRSGFCLIEATTKLNIPISEKSAALVSNISIGSRLPLRCTLNIEDKTIRSRVDKFSVPMCISDGSYGVSFSFLIDELAPNTSIHSTDSTFSGTLYFSYTNNYKIEDTENFNAKLYNPPWITLHMVKDPRWVEAEQNVLLNDIQGELNL